MFISTNVQNLMSYILDLAESSKNVMNWTLPNKTFPLLWVLLLALILCMLIPNRYLVLAIGLQQFTAGKWGKLGLKTGIN